jgi:hypothetical protein
LRRRVSNCADCTDRDYREHLPHGRSLLSLLTILEIHDSFLRFNSGFVKVEVVETTTSLKAVTAIQRIVRLGLRLLRGEIALSPDKTRSRENLLFVGRKEFLGAAFLLLANIVRSRPRSVLPSRKRAQRLC